MAYKLRKSKSEIKMGDDYKDVIKHITEIFSNMESKSGKPLSKLTIASYVAKIQRVYATCEGAFINKDLTNLKWLEDPKKVVKCLKDANLLSLKDYISPIIKLLRHNGVEQPVIDEYSKQLRLLKDDEDKIRNTNTVSETLAERFVPYEDVKQKLLYNIKNVKTLTDEILIATLICSFYYLSELVPRNDLNIVKFKIKDKVTKASQEFNYISTHRSKSGNLLPDGLVWNNYKTRQHFGQVKFKLTEPLNIILSEYMRRWLKVNDDFLLVDKNNKPFTKSNMLDMVRKATETVLGKAQGINVIRRSIITHFKQQPHTIEQEDRFALRFLHSAQKQREYYTANAGGGKEEEGDGSEEED